MFLSVFGWAMEQFVTTTDSIMRTGTTIPEICLMLPCMFVKTTVRAKTAKTIKYTLVEVLSETKVEKQLLAVSLSLRLSMQLVRHWTI